MDYATREQAKIFLTTHSSVVLDLLSISDSAQIVHVVHDGRSAHTIPVKAHFDGLRVVYELGARPSDLLQANRVIWVEGPSDRIYINHWISLHSDCELQEGRNYQCAFYGGSLLARIQFREPDEASRNLANLFQINPNVVVVCDSDRSSMSTALKPRVRRIRDEVSSISNAQIWITRTREIENYIPGRVIGAALGRAPLRDPRQYESFFPKARTKKRSYTEQFGIRESTDKVSFALKCLPHMTKEKMTDRFDWDSQMGEMVNRIKSWNK